MHQKPVPFCRSKRVRNNSKKNPGFKVTVEPPCRLFSVLAPLCLEPPPKFQTTNHVRAPLGFKGTDDECAVYFLGLARPLLLIFSNKTSLTHARSYTIHSHDTGGGHFGWRASFFLAPPSYQTTRTRTRLCEEASSKRAEDKPQPHT